MTVRACRSSADDTDAAEEQRLREEEASAPAPAAPATGGALGIIAEEEEGGEAEAGAAPAPAEAATPAVPAPPAPAPPSRAAILANVRLLRQRSLQRLLDRMTAELTNNPDVWELCAEFYQHTGDAARAHEYRSKLVRACHSATPGRARVAPG